MRLTPRDTNTQQVLAHTLLVEPAPVVMTRSSDYFGNINNYASVQEPHTKLSIKASSTIRVAPLPPPVLADSAPWESIRSAMRSPDIGHAVDAAQFCFPSPHIDIPATVSELTHDLFTPGRPILEAVMSLTTRIYSDFSYQGGVTDIRTPVSEVLTSRQGVCQDFAHLQLACLRYLGLPGRYVSGYLLTHPAPGEKKLVGADESHAWISVWTRENGWVDFDPTNNLIPSNEHIVLGWGRDYADISPINGFIVGGGTHQLEVSVDVSPVPEMSTQSAALSDIK